MTAATRTTTSSPSPTLPVTTRTQATEGAWAQAIAIAIHLGWLRWSCCGPPADDGGKDVLRLPGLVAPAPTHHAAKVHCQFFWTLLPSKTDVPGSTPQAISAVGTPAAQIAGPPAPWPSSAPLWPAAIAVVIVLAAKVRG